MAHKVLVFGNGARQHALAWKLKKSPNVSEVYFATKKSISLEGIKVVHCSTDDKEQLVDCIRSANIDYVVTGSGSMLAEGIVDYLQEHNILVFGPTSSAAKLESSKGFAKQFMKKYNIPTPEYQTFTSLDKVLEFLNNRKEGPVVIKADGLVAGLGVFVCSSKSEATDAVQKLMKKRVFGEKGSKVVVEEFISGPEISLHVMYDGKNYVLFPPAQDHKPIYEGNKGPNTGGMGTYAPVHWVDETMLNTIISKIIEPTIRGLKTENIDFKGMLFPGVMITKDGPMLLEYNVRFGAPETQSYMMLLDSDLDELLYGTITGTLDKTNVKWKEGYAITVELVREGYPTQNSWQDNVPIDVQSGTSFKGQFFTGDAIIENGELIARGGKVLSVSTYASRLQEAIKDVYTGVEAVNFKGKKYRKDIGSLNNEIKE